MTFARFSSVAAAISFALLYASPAWATSRLYDTHFFETTEGKAVCYFRTYSSEHLKKHPKQKIQSLHLLESFRLEWNRF